MSKTPKPATITVVEMPNQNYSPDRPESKSSNPKLVYRVIKAKNTLTVHMGEILSPYNVEDFIRGARIDITIVPENHPAAMV
jgi:hypothetical protein